MPDSITKGKSLPKRASEKNLSTISRDSLLEASYGDDGTIELKIKCLEDGSLPGLGCSGVVVMNNINQLTRLSNARKKTIGTEELLTKVNASLSVFTELKPKDSVEAMMITQMIAVQELALLMSERALLTEQPNQIVEQNVNRVTRLTKSYGTLVEALTKYRSKGKQKIIVQHVQVNDGGQAIVGDVNQGGGND